MPLNPFNSVEKSNPNHIWGAQNWGGFMILRMKTKTKSWSLVSM